MAAVDWPWAMVNILTDGYERFADNNVVRTPFEDGRLRQARTARNPTEVVRFSFFVKESDVGAFRSWAETNAHTWFNFRPLASTTTGDWRVRGGAARLSSLRRLPGNRIEGEPVWTGQVELEARG